MPESSVMDFLTDPDGLFQFTISYPSPDSFPDVRGKSTMLFGYFFEVTDQRSDSSTGKTLLTIRKTKSRGASGSWDTPTVAGQTVLQGAPGAVVSKLDPLAGKTASGATTAAVIPAGGPLLAIAAVVAALAGLGIIYLIVDKVERIVESPGANVMMIVAAVAGLVLLYSLWKKGKLT